MYTKDYLNKYEYFKKILKDTKIEYVIDPLTGVISRKYMLEFIKSLIKDNTPFTMAILDLDNFKDINDNHGHSTGDAVLENVGNGLIDFFYEKGLVGRFGGDEFIFIVFNSNKYEDIYKIYFDLLHANIALRKTFNFGTGDIYVTGTIGSAAYPDNATKYDELFQMADKTLYRGKLKGRNCFIVYVHEKHKDLVINKLANDDEATIFCNINSIFLQKNTYKEKIIELSDYIIKNLRLDYLLYIDKNHNIFNLIDCSLIAKDINLDNIKFNNEIFKTNFKNDIKAANKGLYDVAEKINISSILATKLRTQDKDYGYLIFALERTQKIWQSNEIAIMMYLAKAILIENIKM